MSTRSLSELKNDFPLLQQQGIVYLDSASSSQKPQVVLQALQDFYTTSNANVHRGAYDLSAKATDLYEQARDRVAKFAGTAHREGVIFTRNTTEAINLVAYSWGLKNLSAGDEILVTEMEHHSNLVPWHMLAEYTGAKVVGVTLNSEARLDLQDFAQKLQSGKVKMTAFSHVSNALGTKNPVREMVKLAKDAGSRVLIDGAQGAPHTEIQFDSLGADFYAISGHKMCAPTGIGALIAKPEMLRAMPPFLGGGSMIKQVCIDHSTYADIPARFEAGTPAIAEAVALGVACEYLQDVGLGRIWQHEQALVNHALDQLEQLEGVKVYGARGADRAGVVSFNVEGVHPHDVASFLNEKGVCIRAGHHCAQPLMRALGVQSTARASFYLYNTVADVDAFVAAVRHVRDFFRG